MKALLTAGMMALLSQAALAQDFVQLPPDKPVPMGSIDVVCTGVGLDIRQNPAWTAYPLKVEIAGRGGQYLGDVHVTLLKDGKRLAGVACDGPWLLFKIPAGHYRVEVETEGKEAASNAYALPEGQGRVIIRFPDLGGEITAVPPASQSVSTPPL